MSRTEIWLQTSVLETAFGKNRKKTKNKAHQRNGNGQSVWKWSRCVLVSGDATILDSSPLCLEVVDQDSEFYGRTATIETELLKAEKAGANVVMANDFTSSNGSVPDDLITLTHLHEPALVYSLRKRYEKNIIYTATGPILIALNPFKPLPALYDDVAKNDYWVAGEEAEKSGLKPHIYKTAHAAFRAMMRGIEMQAYGTNDECSISDQVVLVSGESGSGKTATAKHIMNYLASLSQRRAMLGRRRRDASPGRSEPSGPRRLSSVRTSRALSWKAGALVEERILESSPILEAFGNARTVRNDNSSRFGKFIELQFKRTGSLVGARIETYLLEKVRIVCQSEGERNFHIFYELLEALSEDENAKFFLDNYTVSDFKMTNSSGTCSRRDGASDAALFDDLVLAMSTVGFESCIQEDIFSCCAAFLHASNLTFTSPNEESSQVDYSNPHLNPVLLLLGLETDAFNSAVTGNEIEIGKQRFTRQLPVEGAQQALEAFIKETYSAVFSFLVDTINKRIDYKPARGTLNPSGKAATISVLDIFGFESVQSNSFEQLCINYCNEALQQQFNLFVFKNEQEEYKREGIEWEFIEFPDNREVLDLIDNSTTGILSILADQSRAPRTTDKTFVESLYKKCEKHPHFMGSALHKGKGQFIIAHYAGLVLYDSSGFVEKNRDKTPRVALTLLESSSKEFIQQLSKIAARNRTSGTCSSQKLPTLGGQFSSQLTDLRNRIDQTNPHYIRCLKPNQSLQPNDLDCAVIAEQLRHAGVLEAIRISRLGFPQQYTHLGFLNRYGFIWKQRGVAEEYSEISNLVSYFDKATNSEVETNSTGIQLGTNKVFLRQSAIEKLEKMRYTMLAAIAVRLQSAIRRFIYHRQFVRVMHGIIKAQAGVRRFLGRRRFLGEQQNRAAIRVQAWIRCLFARKTLAGKRHATSMHQKVFRGNCARKSYKLLQTTRSGFKRVDDAATTIQCMVRVRFARKLFAGYNFESNQNSKRCQELHHAVQKETINTHRKAAVSRQQAIDRAREVDDVSSDLAFAKNSEAKTESVLAELESMRRLLVNTTHELENTRRIVASQSSQLANLKEENVVLRRQLECEGFVAGETRAPGGSIYSEFPDLEKLDRNMFEMVSRSKKSKDDMKALISGLAVLT